MMGMGHGSLTPMAESPPYDSYDLFAGSGGMTLGLKQAGWHPLGVEYIPTFAETHRKQVGPCLTMDVADFHPKEAVALVAGGSPCKSFSIAGSRRALDDERGKLIFEFIRIAGESAERAFLFENVLGILSAIAYQDQSDLVIDILRAELKKVGFAHIQHRQLDAHDYGTPQLRRRVFFVGFRDKADADRFSWPVPSHGPEAALPHVTAREAVGIPFDAPSPSISAHEHKAGTHSALVIPYRNLQHAYERMVSLSGKVFPKPTIDQYAVLMGYPKGFRFEGTKSEQFQQMGNSVSPLVARALGRSLRQALRLPLPPASA
jgi:DNA (cytosine-5)-methyltransferase 1